MSDTKPICPKRQSHRMTDDAIAVAQAQERLGVNAGTPFAAVCLALLDAVDTLNTHRDATEAQPDYSNQINPATGKYGSVKWPLTTKPTCGQCAWMSFGMCRRLHPWCNIGTDTKHTTPACPAFVAAERSEK